MGTTRNTFLKMYSVWGWILVAEPLIVCTLWPIVTFGARTPREAKEFFVSANAVFAHYDIVWIASAVLSAFAFFFGSRLVGGGKPYAVNGVFMLVVSGTTLALSIVHLLIK